MNVCVIGTGYVGLVTGAGLAELGSNVVCVDIDEKKINNLRNALPPFYEIDLTRLVTDNLKRKRISFTTDPGRGVSNSEIIFIAVGTPPTESGEADLSQIIKVAENLAKIIQGYKIIVIKSTVPVGTFELVQQVLEERKSKDASFDIVSNPEFLREGNAVYDFFHPNRIIIGSRKKKAGQKVAALFKDLNAPIIFTTVENAQMIKYASNVFLASKISFMNEIASICERVKADVTEIAKGMEYDERIGRGYLNAGIGFGGPCLTKDLKALIKIAENHDYDPQYLKSILERNEYQVEHIILKVKVALNGFLYGKTIGVLGLAFKSNTDDVRNSLSIKIVDSLQKEGAKIKAYDPQAVKKARNLLHNVVFCESPYEVANESNVLLTLTAWEEFKKLDLLKIKRQMREPIIVDGVNMYNHREMVKLGFTYVGVGR